MKPEAVLLLLMIALLSGAGAVPVLRPEAPISLAAVPGTPLRLHLRGLAADSEYELRVSHSARDSLLVSLHVGDRPGPAANERRLLDVEQLRLTTDSHARLAGRAPVVWISVRHKSAWRGGAQREAFDLRVVLDPVVAGVPSSLWTPAVSTCAAFAVALVCVLPFMRWTLHSMASGAAGHKDE